MTRCTCLPDPGPEPEAFGWSHDTQAHTWDLRQGPALYASVPCEMLADPNPGLALEVYRRVGSVPPPLALHFQWGRDFATGYQLITGWGKDDN